MRTKSGIFLLATFSSAFAWSQVTAENPLQSQSDLLRQEGRLVSVQLTRGEPLKILVVGREEAKLDLSKMKLVVRRLQPFPEKNLRLEKQGENFLVLDPVKGDADLEVTTELKGSTESFRFKVKAKP